MNTQIQDTHTAVPMTMPKNNGKEVNYDYEVYVAQYKAKGTLPSQHIYCTASGNRITCFGDNLHGKVNKAGGIENLLMNFVCKDARGPSVKAPKVSGKVNKTESVLASLSIEELQAALAAKQAAGTTVSAEEVGDEEAPKGDEHHATDEQIQELVTGNTDHAEEAPALSNKQKKKLARAAAEAELVVV